MPDYRLPWPDLSWWNDEGFNAYLKRFGERDGMNADRRWMLYQLTALVQSVPGDTAECGVFQGMGSYLICCSLPDRTHFLFDSFEGLSQPLAVDGAYWSENTLACDLETVKKNLRECHNVSFHKGWIPDRFGDVEPRRFCFVHIDVDLYQPTADSMQFFYPRMNDGGIIICDDYGLSTCPGATLAVDEFLSDKPEKMIALSCGSAFLIKGLAVQELRFQDVANRKKVAAL